jgi:hypothetical protein
MDRNAALREDWFHHLQNELEIAIERDAIQWDAAAAKAAPETTDRIAPRVRKLASKLWVAAG